MKKTRKKRPVSRKRNSALFLVRNGAKRRKVRKTNRKSGYVLNKSHKRRRNGTKRRARRNGFTLGSGYAQHKRNKARRRRRNASQVVYRYPNKRRSRRRNTAIRVANRRHVKRRRNSAVESLQGMFRRIPIVGDLAAAVVGFAPAAAFGAVSVEPTMQAIRMLAPYYPDLPASVVYAGTGLVIAAIVKKFGSKIVSPATADKLALAAASAAGGVAYYKYRTGQDASTEVEKGVIEFGADGEFGDVGPSVVMSSDDFGALEVVYSDATLADAYAAGDDMTQSEVALALGAPPQAWPRYAKRRHPRAQRVHPAMSVHAGTEFHRWGWLIRLVGPHRFQRIAALPPEHRQMILARLRQAAINEADQAMGGSGVAAGPGAMADLGSILVGI